MFMPTTLYPAPAVASVELRQASYFPSQKSVTPPFGDCHRIFAHAERPYFNDNCSARKLADCPQSKELSLFTPESS